MVLKRLELQGFKSFAQKTVLEFPSRIVAVVGPNGSGKSNVIDALRWVLGEREAKQLRGLTLENLIFAGTPKRPSMGFARVSLHFDNKDGLFPVESSEVVLARRVDRSGVSEFSLNDEEIRLKDLLPILARAKLGTRGLTMIGQGQSTMFVESAPLERRTMIEEILGLKEFRLKKHDAERRLLSSETNLEKVRAQLAELAPHLTFLRRQRKRWEKRAELATELRELENAYYSQKLKNLKGKSAKSSLPKMDFESVLAEKRRAAEAHEKKVQALRGDTSHFEDAKKARGRLEEAFSRISQIERELAKLEVKMEYAEKGHAPSNVGEMEEALKFAERELSSLAVAEDMSAVRAALDRVLSRIRKILGGEEKSAAPDTFSKEREKLEAERLAIEAEIQELRAREESLAAEERKANESFRRELELLEEKKNEIRKIEEALQEERFEKEKTGIRLEEIRREWAAFGRSPEELEALPESNLETSEQEAERKMFRLRGQLSEVGDIDEALLKEADESEKRHEFLTKELADVEAAAADLKKLIHNLDMKIREDFEKAFHTINEEFQKYFALMFGGGRAKLKIQKIQKKAALEEGEESPKIEEPEEEEKPGGVDIEVNVPKKKITNLEMLSGGEKSLVSLAALFALIAVSPPPFLVLDEIDAALDEANARRFSELVKNFSSKSQFIIVTHNRATMEAADVLYGVTMADDGVSKILSIQLGDGLTEKSK